MKTHLQLLLDGGVELRAGKRGLGVFADAAAARATQTFLNKSLRKEFSRQDAKAQRGTYQARVIRRMIA